MNKPPIPEIVFKIGMTIFFISWVGIAIGMALLFAFGWSYLLGVSVIGCFAGGVMSMSFAVGTLWE